MLQHGLEETLGNLSFQKPVAVLREYRHLPDSVIHLEAHEPAKQQVVLKLLHQHSFAANRVQNLEQQGAQQLLGGNRRATSARV